MSNVLVLLGNVGGENSVRSHKNEDGRTVVISFSLAVKEYRYNPTTKQSEVMTDWINAKAYAGVAERIERFVAPGQKLMLTGRLFTEKYEKDGQPRTSCGIEIKDFTLAGGGAGEGNQSGSSQPAASYDDDDIPF